MPLWRSTVKAIRAWPYDSLMFRAFLLLTLTTLSLSSPAAEPDFADRDSAISALYPDHSLLESATGDLNGDGRPEIVVTLAPPSEPDRKKDVGQMLRLVVFTTNEKGRLDAGCRQRRPTNAGIPPACPSSASRCS